MAKRQRVFKVNVVEVEKQIALLRATKQKEKAASILNAAKEFGIVVSEEHVKKEQTVIEEIAEALKNIK